jgi:hypothetical protein
MNPKLAAELEIQQIADDMGLSNSAAEAIFREREAQSQSVTNGGLKVCVCACVCAYAVRCVRVYVRTTGAVRS